MPAYTGPAQATLLRDNRQMYLFQNETVVVGESSVAVQLDRVSGTFYPWGVSFHISFSGAPGAFEIDVQTSDVDQDSDYVTINALTTGGLNASNVGRVELPNFWAKYVRVKVVSFANFATVNLSVLVTR
jgi:hypothetical protein